MRLDKQRASSLVQSITVLVLLAAGSGFLAATPIEGDSMRPMLRYAGRAALVALFVFSVLGAVIGAVWLASGGQPSQEQDDRVGRVSDGWWLTAAEEWDWPTQKAYLRDVDAARAGFSQAGAAEWGDIEPEQFNALVRRMVTLQMYEYANGRDHSNGGRWTARGKEMLQGIRSDD